MSPRRFAQPFFGLKWFPQAGLHVDDEGEVRLEGHAWTSSRSVTDFSGAGRNKPCVPELDPG